MTNDEHIHYFNSSIHHSQMQGLVQLQCACDEVRTFGADADETG